MKKFAIFFLLLVAPMSGCEQREAATPASVAQQFAEALCNYDFARARACATADGARVVLFRASNVTQQELDDYRAQAADVTAEVVDVTQHGDTAAAATLRTSSGERFTLVLVVRDGRWLVESMSAL